MYYLCPFYWREPITKLPLVKNIAGLTFSWDNFSILRVLKNRYSFDYRHYFHQEKDKDKFCGLKNWKLKNIKILFQ